MTRLLRRHGLATALCACAIAVASGCGAPSTEEVETTAAVAVTTAAATRANVTAMVHATGIVSAAPGAEFVVIAPEPARIADIPYASGEHVRRGDLLVRFEVPASAAEVQKQRAEVARADAGLENARATQARARGLFDRGVAARREVEDADRTVADAEAAVAQAKAALEAADVMERRTTVRAPFDGVVAARLHNPGDLVEAGAGDPVLRLVDPDRIEIVAAVPLADALRVASGARARLVSTPAGLADSDLAVVSRPTAVEPGTATVPVRLAFARAVAVPVGMPVQVEIAAEDHQDVVTVPTGALVRESGGSAVFVVRGGVAHRVVVEVGLTDGARVEILSGVEAGDRVVVDGQAGLPDEAPVTEGVPGGADAAPPAGDGQP